MVVGGLFNEGGGGCLGRIERVYKCFFFGRIIFNKLCDFE